MFEKSFKLIWYLLLFLCVEFGMLIYLWYHYSQETVLVEKLYLNNLQSTYDMTLKHYTSSMQLLYADIIHQHDIVKSLHHTNHVSATQIQNAQAALQQYLQPIYQRLQQIEAYQLDFYLANGEHLLSINASGQITNPLLSSHLSASSTQITQTTEIKYIKKWGANGFYTSFPIFYQNESIGKLDISIPFSVIAKHIKEHDRSYAILINKTLVTKEMLAQKSDQYTHSTLSSAYWQINLAQTVPLFLPTNLITQINNALLPYITHQFSQHTEFVLNTSVNGYVYVVSFLPLYQQDNSDVLGYLVAYQADNSFAHFQQHLLQQIVISSSILLILFITFYTISHNRRLLWEKHQALQHSETMFRQVNAAALDGIIIIDNQGLVLYWNQAAEDIFGYAATETEGKNLYQLIIPPEIPQSTIQTQNFAEYQVTGTGNVVGKLVEFTAMRRNGERFPVEVSVVPLLLDNKLGAVGTIRDISRRKTVEDRLRKLSRAVEQSANSVVITDLEGHIEFVNPAFLHITGYKEEEILGKNPRFLKSGRQHSKVFQQLWHTIKRGQVWRGELINKRKSGELYWEQVTISPIKDRNGISTHYIGIKEDISARKQVERELQDNVNFLETLLRTIPMPVFYKNHNGHYLGCNPDFAHFVGISSENLVGKTKAYLTLDHASQEQDKASDELLLSEGGKHTQEMKLVDARGGRHEVILTKATYTLADGSIGGIVGAFTDISELKQAKDQLEKQNQDLMQLNQEKNEFLAIAAHDLKNPLSGIKGLAAEIREDFDKLSQAEIINYAEMIHANSQRMFNLISNLLDVNAIESNSLRLNLDTVNLTQILQTVLQYQQELAKRKNIVLDFKNEAQRRHVIADADSLYQVLDNIISNAIKYSPPNSKTQITIYEDNIQLFCCVQDEGPGLSALDQEKLFGKFTRLSPKPTAGEHSTGLGLFIVKKLVEAMRGQIWCESTLGEGSRFYVALPLADDIDIPEAPPPAVVTHSTDSTLRILLAEDNMVNQKVARLVFRKLGYQIDLANDGEEVLTALKEQAYDLIFMDIHMPKLDGISTTKHIREHYGTTTPWIIALTASDSIQSNQQYLAIGMQAFLSKPFDKLSLSRIMDAYFKASASLESKL